MISESSAFVQITFKLNLDAWIWTSDPTSFGKALFQMFWEQEGGVLKHNFIKKNHTYECVIL